MLGIAKALKIVRHDILHPGHPGCPGITLGAQDEDWLPIVGVAGWAVLMRDQRIKDRPGEQRALMDHGVRAFCLVESGQHTNWEMLRIIVRLWDRIEETAALAGPYIYGVTARRLVKIL